MSMTGVDGSKDLKLLPLFGNRRSCRSAFALLLLKVESGRECPGTICTNPLHPSARGVAGPLEKTMNCFAHLVSES